MEEKIIATFNGKHITNKDLQEIISRFPAERQQHLATPEGRKELLNEVVSFEVLYEYAKDSSMEEEKDFLIQLENAKKEILTQIAIKKIISSVKVDEEDIVKFYESNKEMFKTEENITAKHILVKTLEECNSILNEIKNGMKFEKAAEKYSTCPSKNKGGALGTFGHGRMVPPFEKAAFTMSAGEISEPVKTQFGYHLIFVEDKKPESIIALDEVKGSIYAQVLQEKQKDMYISFVDDLKKKYNVNIQE
ncbi:peptidylprolyl isomerase [Clostridium sp. HMP27]|uniref:peptidylprolyl isomerase n=1 Tax=Clostridium sp. HMP27 TaxID=1487921 RepID=UPI00052BE436|nr:peptidylprolyl isomerase [Clostridium sp. HMP27]